MQVRAQIEKRKRIDELEELNFNVPKNYFVSKECSSEELDSAASWAVNMYKIKKENNEPEVLNIRTYSYDDIFKKESISTPHHFNLRQETLISLLPSLIRDYSLILNAESPNLGRISGNIALIAPNDFVIEFVIKSHKAMVRDIDREPFYHLEGAISHSDFGIEQFINHHNSISTEFPIPISTIESVLKFIPRQASTYHSRNIILEFTYFEIPAGIFSIDQRNKPEAELNTVWWEWRPY